MPTNTSNDTVSRWLAEAQIDLQSARLLFDAKLYPRALYHLQQGNEKLAKGLLIAMGFLTPKLLKDGWITKNLLGFVPKEPISYGHRTAKSLISDVDRAIPTVEKWMKFLVAGEFEPKISEFRKTIRQSKKDVKELKKKQFGVIETSERLGNEIKGVESILDRVDPATAAMKQELEKLDLNKAVLAAIKSARKAGFIVNPESLPSYASSKDEVIHIVRLSIISTLAVAMTTILDPLESVTRYPDSKRPPFDEKYPYVEYFGKLYSLIGRCIQMGQSELGLS